MRSSSVRWISTVALVTLAISACNDPVSVEPRSISLHTSQQYELPTVGGDEEGARISVQARHFMISEIRRTPETGLIATYVYRPSVGFVGTDYAEIEVLTGSDGASPPSAVRRIQLYFTVNED